MGWESPMEPAVAGAMTSTWLWELRASPASVPGASPGSFPLPSRADSPVWACAPWFLWRKEPSSAGLSPGTGSVRDVGRQSDRNRSLSGEEALPVPLLHLFPCPARPRVLPLAQNSPFPRIVLPVFPLASFFLPSLAQLLCSPDTHPPSPPWHFKVRIYLLLEKIFLFAEFLNS